MKPKILLPLILAASVLQALAAELPAETPAQKDARMAWFRDARFGMFIHWGVYSVPAGEWNGNKNYGEWFLEETKMPVSQYEKFATQFNPVKFDAKAWARMAKDAGMKYLVITSKHHDGFGMWRSESTDWCIKSTPFQRDPLKELAAACKEEGIVFCLYHSIMDWHHPDWGTRRKYHDKAPSTPPDMDRYTAYMKGQLKELITGYGPLGILWFDGEWEGPWTHERGVDLYQFVRGLQPDIIVNNRVGKGRSGMQGMDKGQGVGDYGTPEQEIPPTGFGPGVDWESCMTMNGHWGYNKHDQNWKSTAMLVRNLVDCASKGGNYLLNIGPTAEGEFPQASVDRLREIGVWMKKNSASVYGTTASPFRKLPWGRCTVKAAKDGTTNLYLHVFDWPQGGKLFVPGLKNQVLDAKLLENGAKVNFIANEEGVTLMVPAAAPDPIDTVLVLKIQGAPRVEAFAVTPEADGSLVLAPETATTTGGLKVEAEKACLGFWLDAADTASWEVKLPAAGNYRVEVETAALQNSAIKLSAGAQTVAAKVAASGDYGKFRATTFDGTLKLAAGRQTIVLAAAANPWQPVNVRKLVLKRVAD